MHREYDLINERLTKFSQDIGSHTDTHTHVGQSNSAQGLTCLQYVLYVIHQLTTT